MNLRKLVPFVLAFAACAAFADTPTVTDVAARQRWPWSPKVDIDFTLVSEKSCDVEIAATWQGQTVPVRLDAGMTESLFCVEPGVHHMSWDPAKAGLADRDLVDFKVTVTPKTFEDRLYLVLDLIDGSYTYLSEVPQGGWAQFPYKNRKMVFRRIPAGTYALGYDAGSLDNYMGTLGSAEIGYIKQTMRSRTGTWTSDFYMGIHIMTIAQSLAIQNGEESFDPNYLTPTSPTYVALRGDKDTDGVNWPLTKFKVSPTSTLGKLRAKIDGSLMVDLPTDMQWEIAARANTTTFYPNGGTTANTSDELYAIYDSIAWSSRNNGGVGKEVGTRDATPWGLYDVCGNGNNWVLDVQRGWEVDGRSNYPEYDDSDSGIDQVGKSIANGNQYQYHTVRGTSWNTSPLAKTFVGLRRAYKADAVYMGCARFCIHLKPPQSFNGQWFPAE